MGVQVHEIRLKSPARVGHYAPPEPFPGTIPASGSRRLIGQNDMDRIAATARLTGTTLLTTDCCLAAAPVIL